MIIRQIGRSGGFFLVSRHTVRYRRYTDITNDKLIHARRYTHVPRYDIRNLLINRNQQSSGRSTADPVTRKIMAPAM